MGTAIGLFKKGGIGLFAALAIMLSILTIPAFAQAEVPCTHPHAEWIMNPEPSCTEPGLEELYCFECNTVLQSNSIDPLGHDRREMYIHATCTESGSYRVWCDRCGNTLVDDTIAPMGHEPGEWELEYAPSCTETGLEIMRCFFCWEIIDSRQIAALGHDFGNWKLGSIPTCTEPGYEYRECDRCCLIEEITIEPLGHEYSSWSHVEGTSGTDGQHTRSCGLCGYTETESCSPGDWVITVPPCTQDGTRVKYCTVCGYALVTETLDETGHVTSWKIMREATKTTSGLRIRYCTQCGKEFGKPVTYKLPK